MGMWGVEPGAIPYQYWQSIQKNAAYPDEVPRGGGGGGGAAAPAPRRRGRRGAGPPRSAVRGLSSIALIWSATTPNKTRELLISPTLSIRVSALTTLRRPLTFLNPPPGGGAGAP